jgi:hypothetical protein
MAAHRCVDDAVAGGEQRLGRVAVEPFRAEHEPAVGQVGLLRAGVVDHVAPRDIPLVDRLSLGVVLHAAFEPAKAGLRAIGEGSGDLELREVGVGQVFQKLALALRLLSTVLAAGQDPVIGARAALGAKDPVHALGDDVVGQRLLPTGAQDGGVLGIPLVVIVEGFIHLHLTPARGLGVELAQVVREKAVVELQHARAIEV